MGIYDRDYYRGEGSRYLDTLIPSGQVCKWLILINVGVFIVQLMGARISFTQALVLAPEAVWNGEVWRLLTYAFVHDFAWTHLFFNMLFLWWFGSDLETLYGSKEFLTYYLTAALVGGVAFAGVGWLREDPTPCLGASGAVTAVLLLYACHFPTSRIYMFFVLPVPIWIFLGFHILQDTMVFVAGLKTGTAVTVHLAGAAFGGLYYSQRWHLSGLFDSLRAWRRRQAGARLRVYRPDDEREEVPVPVSATHGSDLDEHLEAKLDAVLEKVARSGQSSLSDNERQILLRASEIYKKKRT